MIRETKAPDHMPVETVAEAGALFQFGRAARRRGDDYASCPYSIAANGARWREGWRFEDGIIQSQEALASYERSLIGRRD